MKKCGQIKQQIKKIQAELETTKTKNQAIKDTVRSALTALNKGQVGFELMDPRPYINTIGRAYLQDIVEYGKDVSTINRASIYFNQLILHNSFDGKH